METYRLSSKLTSTDREIVIQTSNDSSVCAILSTVFVDGQPADVTKTRHPGEWNPEDILTMVKSRHSEKKEELEFMLKTYQTVFQNGESKALFELGIAFYYKRLFPEAHNLLESAIKLNPKFDGAYNYLSRTFHELKRNTQAVDAARQAVSLKPSYADYRLTLGEALMAAGGYREAVEEFEESVRINTYYGDAYFCLGLALLLNGVHQKDTSLFASVITRSADSFKRAGIIETEYEGELFAEGFRLLDQKDIESAYHLFRKIYDARKRDKFHDLSSYYMKYVHFHGEQTPDSLDRRISYLEDEVRHHPDYADLHTELAGLYLQKSRLACEQALGSFRRALDVNPSLNKVEKQLAAVEKGLDAIDDLVLKVTRE